MRTTRLAIVGNQAFAMRNFRGALIETLAARGVEVYALAPDYDDASRRAIEALGGIPLSYPIRRASVSPLHDIQTMWKLIRLLRGIRPDVVLSFTAKPVVFGTLAAWMVGVPRRYALIEGLGHAFIETSTARPRGLRSMVSRLYRVSLSRAHSVFFLNDDDLNEFVRDGLVSPDKALKIGAIGVDLDEWQPAPPVVDPLTFLFAGRLLREKGIVEFVDAARLVKAQHPKTRFVVLGATDMNPSSIGVEEIEAWTREGVVEWPGHVDVKPWLEQSSVFVLPSYREGLPRSTQEAMAMAKPIITTDVPGCRDTIVRGENGIIVPSNDSVTLAEAMLRFVTDPSLIATMGAASRRLAEERFDVHSATNRISSAMGLA